MERLIVLKRGDPLGSVKQAVSQRRRLREEEGARTKLEDVKKEMLRERCRELDSLH